MAETNGARDARLEKVHARAMERFDRDYACQREMRLQCVQDRRFVFVPGAQYDGELGDQFANRPRFEINKVHQSVIRVFSEYRNNRVSVDFRPDEEGLEEDSAEFLDGLYRADEQESGAQEAYDTAFEEGVAGGMGAWRLINAYEDDEDEDDERQRIRMVPIPDADQSVFFDKDAKSYDKSDAGHCTVICGMQDDAYEEQYDDDPGAMRKQWQMTKRKLDPSGKGITSFDKVERIGRFDWFTPDTIFVAEYYEVEAVKCTISVYKSSLSGEEQKLKSTDYDTKDEFAAAVKELADQGFTLARQKKTTVRKIHKYILDGARVLEDCGYIAGKHIPVIPYYAKRLFVDGLERFMGQTRLAVDLQRLYNMLASMLAEISVRSPVEKPIFFPAQIVGHEQTWAEDDIKRYPYALINPMVDPATGQLMPAGPVAFTKPPAIPPALAGLLELIGMDLKEILNANGDQQEVVSNISAKAVELIQNRLDMQNFIYMDNFKKSMKRCGEVWLSMARDLYDEDERPMRTVNADGSDEVKKLRQPKVLEDQSTTYLNDPAGGKFKCIADVGPSFTTRRDGTVRAITGMMQFVEDPQDKSVLANVAIQNLEGEGLADVKAYFRRKGVAAGVIKPTDDEAKQLAQEQANAQPDANSQFLLASAQKAQADAAKAHADMQLTLQKIKESEANIAALFAKIEAGKWDQLLQLAETMKAPEQPAAAPQPEAQPA